MNNQVNNAVTTAVKKTWNVITGSVSTLSKALKGMYLPILLCMWSLVLVLVSVFTILKLMEMLSANLSISDSGFVTPFPPFDEFYVAVETTRQEIAALLFSSYTRFEAIGIVFIMGAVVGVLYPPMINWMHFVTVTLRQYGYWQAKPMIIQRAKYMFEALDNMVYQLSYSLLKLVVATGMIWVVWHYLSHHA